MLCRLWLGPEIRIRLAEEKVRRGCVLQGSHVASLRYYALARAQVRILREGLSRLGHPPEAVAEAIDKCFVILLYRCVCVRVCVCVQCKDRVCLCTHCKQTCARVL